MTDGEEKAYILGIEATALSVLNSIRQDLPPEATTDADALAELGETRSVLFSLFGHLKMSDQYDHKLHTADLVRRLDRHLSEYEF